VWWRSTKVFFGDRGIIWDGLNHPWGGDATSGPVQGRLEPNLWEVSVATMATAISGSNRPSHRHSLNGERRARLHHQGAERAPFCQDRSAFVRSEHWL